MPSNRFFDFINIEEYPLPVLAYERDSQKLVEINKAGSMTLGFSVKDIEKYNLSDFIKVDKDYSSGKSYKSVITSITQQEFSIEFKHKEYTENQKSIGLIVVVSLQELARTSATLDKPDQGTEEETMIFGKLGRVELDLETSELTVSPELYHLLDVKVSSPQRITLDQFLLIYMCPEYVPLIRNEIAKGVEATNFGRYDLNIKFEMITATGRRIFVDVKGTFHKNKALGILQDISEKKQNELEVIRKGRLIEVMVRGITDGFFSTDTQLNVVIVNPVFAALINMREEAVVGKNIMEIFTFDSDDQFLSRCRDSISTGVSHNFEHSSRLNPERTFQINIYPNTEGLFVYFKDITIHKQIESELRESALHLATLQRQAHLGSWQYDIDSGRSKWSDEMFRIFDLKPERGVGTWKDILSRIHPDDYSFMKANYEKSLRGESLSQVEFRIVNSSRETLWLELCCESSFDCNGNVKFIAGRFQDITKRKKIELALQENIEYLKKGNKQIAIEKQDRLFQYKANNTRLLSDSDFAKDYQLDKALLNALQQKEILIKEIHHRVKNNLQLISSILYIRMSKMEKGSVKDFLEDARQKIRAIALIHERLLQTETLNEVELNDYLGRLILDLQITYIRQDLDVKILTQIDYIKMALDSTIYCGLIVNELVTNALRHAFVGYATGSISVRFNKVENLHRLEVFNDGIPLPENISIGSSGSFGMHMLDVFIKQLKGTVEINRAHGTSICITF